MTKSTTNSKKSEAKKSKEISTNDLSKNQDSVESNINISSNELGIVKKKKLTRRRTYDSNSTAFYILATLLVILAACFMIFSYIFSNGEFDSSLFLTGLTIGAGAQLVDGALGMAYGVTATAILLSKGISPATATGSVHIAEIFTTGASGLSHWRMGNVNMKLFKALIIPGVIGGLIGVFLITSIDGDKIRPWISAYLLFMGISIFFKAFKRTYFRSKVNKRKITPLALFGGFVDSAGGGGWGSVVTANLLGSGHEPRKTIGSVNAAEFFITIITGSAFAIIIGFNYWEIVAGLIISGMIIAPISAKILSNFPIRPLMAFVGSLIIMLSGFVIYQSFF
ncbi:sulfite exporter TauE/SafE family protein [Rickettsiales bacterium]|jgi:uncharacterized protein|nr:sulfite exporter TauE/SafE family protein [Rickettsiales bacterium]|tara:strand:+ start:4848 stop:5861 length:1014 start_codon:yes stop_codon:yes gene_type:complete